MNVVEKRIRELESDPRFAKLVASDDDTTSVSIWVLDLKRGDTTATRMLFAWLLCADDSSSSEWKTGKRDWRSMCEGVANDKFRLGKLTWVGNARVVSALMTRLAEGGDLATACRHVGAPEPESFGGISLGLGVDEIEQRYETGPMRFLTRAAGDEIIEKPFRPMRSPSRTGNVLSASLSLLHKTALWRDPVTGQNDNGTPRVLPCADDIARQCLEYLSAETGLAFQESDARRIGDIEWLVAPSTDYYEREYVKVQTIKRLDDAEQIVAESVSVSVAAGPLAHGTNLLVRCRLFESEEIVTDECRELQVGHGEVVFQAPQSLSRIVATIWTKESGGVFRIWYEEDSHLILAISLGMGISGARGQLSTDWTRSMATSRRNLQARVDKVSAIDQVSYERMEINHRVARTIAEREMAELARRLFPTQSRGRFFKRGWLDEGGLGFLEWFKKLTDDSHASAFVLIDPYFDAGGVLDLIGRVRATQAEYVVLTNTQILSRDDARGGPARAERLEDACKRLQPILSSIRLTLLDIRSRGSGKDQLFHDRYFLIYGHDARLKEGFALSNSIQGATKNDPMLVTPIPEDVLANVGAYVDGLRACDASLVGEADLHTLYSTGAMRRQRTQETASDVKVPFAAGFFACLLQKPHLSLMDEAQLGTFLNTHSLKTPDGKFSLPPDIENILRGFFDLLAQSDDHIFAQLWTAFSIWGRYLVDREEVVRTALASNGTLIVGALERYLRAVPTMEPPLGTKGLPFKDGSTSITRYFYTEFESSLSLASNLRNVRADYSAEGQPIREAVRILLSSAPRNLIGIAETISEAIPTAQREIANSIENIAAARVLAAILGALNDTWSSPSADLQSALFASRVPLLRAIAACSVTRAPDVTQNLERLSSLRIEERLLVLAELVGGLRVKANINGYSETDEIKQTRMQVFSELMRGWPATMDAVTLAALAFAMSGPSPGSWAMSTTVDLFKPLVRANKLSWASVASVWGELLVKKMTGMLKGDEQFFFHATTDTTLSEAFALSVISTPDPTQREQWRARIAEVSGKATRMIRGPFARSRDHDSWSHAWEVLLWTWCLCAMQLLRAVTDSLPVAEGESLRADTRGLAKTIKRLPAGHNAELLSFGKHIATQLDEGDESVSPFPR